MVRKEGFKVTTINKIGVIGLISSLSLALMKTVWSVHLESFLGDPSKVAFLITIFTLVGLFSFIALTPMVEKRSKTKLLFFSLFLFILSYLAFYLLNSLTAVIIIGVLFSIVLSLRVTCFGIIVSDKSSKTKLSKNEGIIYTFMNLAWLVGPLIAGFIAQRYGVRSVFLVAAIFAFISFSLFKSFRIVDNKTSKKTNNNFIKVFFEFFKNKDRAISYITSGGINFWWTLIYIFIPLFIIDSGFDDLVLGFFLFAVIIPLILCEYKFGKLAGRIGFKKMSLWGYLILAFFAILAFFISSPLIILGILVLASFGGAMIEGTSEAYFFDITKKEEKQKYYGTYNTAIDTGSLIASFLSGLLLLIFPFKAIFLFFGISMFAIALLSFKLRKVVETKKA